MTSLRTVGIAVCAVASAVLGSAHAGPAPWVRQELKDQVKGCRVQLYEDPHFQGARWSTTNGWAVVGWEFGNQISSIRIRSGVWQFFKGPNFEQQIETLFPGSYPQLKPTLDNAISSFRCVRAT